MRWQIVLAFDYVSVAAGRELSGFAAFAGAHQSFWRGAGGELSESAGKLIDCASNVSYILERVIMVAVLWAYNRINRNVSSCDRFKLVTRTA